MLKYNSSNSKQKFHGRKCNLKKKWNKNNCWCECKNLIKYHMCERDYFWNSSTISRILILVKKNCKISGFEDFLNTEKISVVLILINIIILVCVLARLKRIQKRLLVIQ